MNKVAAIDLFCGAGGLTHGLIKGGISVSAGIDISEACKYPYEKNNFGAKFIHKDVKDLTGSELLGLYPQKNIKLLAGCAPCQPFSKYSQGRDVENDKKWPLLYEFSRLIGETSPELVTMENVPDVTRHKVYHDFIHQLREQGYNVWADKIYCPDYGIPQGRSRHVLLASRLGEIKLIKATHKPKNYKNVRNAIAKLPPIKAGEQCKKDNLHISAGLSPLNMQRIKCSKPGGTWHDWPVEIRANCHKKSTGRGYVSVYARMGWDEPSPTITTQSYGFGNGRFGHPEQDRAISLREAAILQTFPRSYKFTPPTGDVSMSSIGMMIGNAVPVTLGKVIAKSITAHLTKV